MIRLRPYKETDAHTILSWCKNEVDFYKWTAGVLGNYPITEKEFNTVKSLIAFTAFDESGIVGFFTLRNPGDSLDELRFGFVMHRPRETWQRLRKSNDTARIEVCISNIWSQKSIAGSIREQSFSLSLL